MKLTNTSSTWILTLALSFSLLVACSPPKYVAPDDPWEKLDLLYIADAAVVERGIKRLQNYEGSPPKWSKIEGAELFEAVSRLGNSARAGHVPSMATLGDFLLEARFRFVVEGIFADLLSKKGRQPPRDGPDSEQLNEFLAQGKALLTIAARTGFPPAIQSLKERGMGVPNCDLKPRKVMLTEKRYQAELHEHQARKAAFGRALGAALLGAMEVYTANKFGRAVTPNNQSSGGLAYQASGSQTCSYDLACGIGQKCLKGSMSLTGICATPVDDFNRPSYNVDSGEVKPNCSFDLECSIGFRCLKVGGGFEGYCVK